MYSALVLLGLLPSFAWLAFYLQEDLHPEPPPPLLFLVLPPEPRRLIFFPFLAGAAVTLVVFALQLAWNSGAELLGFSSRGLAALFGLAAIEELFKFGRSEEHTSELQSQSNI